MSKQPKVHKDEYGDEFVYMPSGGGPNDRVFTKVYLDELGYDPRKEDED